MQEAGEETGGCDCALLLQEFEAVLVVRRERLNLAGEKWRNEFGTHARASLTYWATRPVQARELRCPLWILQAVAGDRPAQRFLTSSSTAVARRSAHTPRVRRWRSRSHSASVDCTSGAVCPADAVSGRETPTKCAANDSSAAIHQRYGGTAVAQTKNPAVRRAAERELVQRARLVVADDCISDSMGSDGVLRRPIAPIIGRYFQIMRRV
jgi:hypothetical protein